MSLCTGNGNCIYQCVCVCDSDMSHAACTCGHRFHNKMIGGEDECNIYCREQCKYQCVLVECHNFKLCKQKRPQWVLNSNKEMCIDCAIMIGKITFLNEIDDCPICFNHKDMIMINCEKHKVCIDCWKEWSDKCIQPPVTCPLCREPIWK